MTRKSAQSGCLVARRRIVHDDAADPRKFGNSARKLQNHRRLNRAANVHRAVNDLHAAMLKPWIAQAKLLDQAGQTARLYDRPK